MNFLFGAIILDCIANSNKGTSENGSGVLVSIGLIIYTLFQLPKIEQYILTVCSNQVTLIGVLIAGFTLLIPTYWAHSKKYISIKNQSIWVNVLLRIMIYLNVFCGIVAIVIVSNKIGQYPASYMFNIQEVARDSQSDKFFLSLFASLGYLLIKLLDFISVIGLIPLVQIIIFKLAKKNIKLFEGKNNQYITNNGIIREYKEELNIVDRKINSLIEFDFHNRKYKK
ncbi:hypothetical protein OD350_29390 (plasmid) [Clostridium beijerinckii]|uniref:hypothetical protein n=1 Tax=Clostridium beijerinckii TaxID=1520 RepID=UPI0022269080|nr:hypothetical protein [Clostridium beijerinckii]UYZ39004.1 hypothetical protein OD350_29390 [Clostridium beijerinckii]